MINRFAARTRETIRRRCPLRQSQVWAQGARRCFPGLIVVLVLLLPGCQPVMPGALDESSDGSDSRIRHVEISPKSFLLTGAGQTALLSARAFDVDGQELGIPITWSSSNPDVLSVDENGLATAVADLGSAQITATAGGVSSAPALGLLATPASGATLVSDEQVIGDPVPVDANAGYGLGYRYTVTLSRSDVPSIGGILLGTGAKPVAGRVVDIAADGDPAVVTLEIIKAAELFDELIVDVHADLSQLSVEIPANVSEAYEVLTDADGTMHFIPRGDDATTAGQAKTAGQARRIGPFECTARANFPVTFAQPPIFSVRLNTVLDFAYDSQRGGLQRLILSGEPKVTLGYSPVITAALGGSIECAIELLKVRAPVFGPLSVIISPLFTLEAGLAAGGSITVAQIGFESSAEITTRATIGVDCTQGVCRMVNSLVVPDPVTSYKPILPNFEHPEDQLGLNLSLEAFGRAKLKIGNPFLTDLAIEFIKIKAGAALELALFTPQAQALDPAKAGKFKLALKATAGLSDEGSINEFLANVLSVSFAEVGVAFDTTLSASPKGALTITPPSVLAGDDTRLGDEATFTTTFDKSTFLGFEAIDGVDYFVLRNGRLEPGRPLCSHVAGSPGQTSFTCQTDFTAADLGEQKFYAFYNAKLFGVPLLFPLEVTDNSEAKVVVTDGVAVTVSPSSITLQPGQQQQFSASVTGTSDTAVTWSTAGGDIDPTGLFTAGATPGTFSIRATSVADPQKFAAASVTIATIAPCAPWELTTQLSSFGNNRTQSAHWPTASVSDSTDFLSHVSANVQVGSGQVGSIGVSLTGATSSVFGSFAAGEFSKQVFINAVDPELQGRNVSVVMSFRVSASLRVEQNSTQAVWSLRFNNVGIAAGGLSPNGTFGDPSGGTYTPAGGGVGAVSLGRTPILVELQLSGTMIPVLGIPGSGELDATVEVIITDVRDEANNPVAFTVSDCIPP